MMLVLALLFALALDSGLLRLARVVRLGIFVPYAVPERGRLAHVGLPVRAGLRPVRPARARRCDVPVPHFLSSGWMLGSLANIVTWEFTGYNMIILYAALRADPARALRGGGGRRRRRLADRLVRQASRAAAGAHAHA